MTLHTAEMVCMIVLIGAFFLIPVIHGVIWVGAANGKHVSGYIRGTHKTVININAEEGFMLTGDIAFISIAVLALAAFVSPAFFFAGPPALCCAIARRIRRAGGRKDLIDVQHVPDSPQPPSGLALAVASLRPHTAVSSRFCGACGDQLPSGVSFCPACGAAAL